MNNTTTLDILTPNNLDLRNPYICTTFVWMILTMIFNGLIVVSALNGWLINPKITRQVVIASSLAVVWIGIYLSKFFATHRSFQILIVWTGYPLTLMIALQHVELLKLFVILSNFWTQKKCRIFQVIVIGIHVILTWPQYIIWLAFENNATIAMVLCTNSACRWSSHTMDHIHHNIR